jgi:hypothetical protein
MSHKMTPAQVVTEFLKNFQNERFESNIGKIKFFRLIQNGLTIGKRMIKLEECEWFFRSWEYNTEPTCYYPRRQTMLLMHYFIKQFFAFADLFSNV